MQNVQTGIFVGGCCDGFTMTLPLPDQERVYMPPPLAALQPPTHSKSPTTSTAHADVYLLTTLSVYPDGVRLLLYRHEKLSEVQAFQMIFEHYGRKA